MSELQNNNHKSKKVSISVVVVLVIAIFGWIFLNLSLLDGKIEATNSNMNNSVNGINENIGGMKVDIGIIMTNVSWIKGALEK